MTNRKLPALATKHQPIPAVATRAAATVGPSTLATFTHVLFSVTASRISDGSTTSDTNACRAGLSAALSVPNASASANTPWRSPRRGSWSPGSPSSPATTCSRRPLPYWASSSPPWQCTQRSPCCRRTPAGTSCCRSVVSARPGRPPTAPSLMSCATSNGSPACAAPYNVEMSSAGAARGRMPGPAACSVRAAVS